MVEHTNASPPAETSSQGATYVSPRLVVYGALTDITRAVGSSSNMGGGAAAGMMMSQP